MSRSVRRPARPVLVPQLVLSACSSYFEHLFTMHPDKAPLVILKDIKYEDIKAIVEFMYQGEINISQVGEPPAG